MKIDELSKAIWDVHRASVGHDVGSDCKPGEDPKKCKKNRRKRPHSVFPVLYPGHMGTPRTFKPGSANDSLQTGGAASRSESAHSDGVDGPGSGEQPLATEASAKGGCRPSRARVMHELKRSLGLVEFTNNHSWAGTPGGTNPNPAWGGYSIPQFGMVKMRGGGPTIGGPGFRHNGDGEGGKYDFRKSPGIGFRTETGWRLWKAALDVIDKDKTATRPQILMQAMQKAGVHRGQIDPSELRLLEMGIEWYLTSPGAVAARRGAAYGPYSGGHTDAGGFLSGRGAP